MMRNTKIALCGLLAGFAFLAGACASHDHKSVSTYDYSEHDDSQRQPQAERTQPSSEYQMVSPGEMTSPGKPVVDPR